MAVRFSSAEHYARILAKGIDPFDTQAVLLEGWEPSFQGRTPQPAESRAFLDAHARRWPMASVSPPSRSGTRRSIERARNAVPGPDGIPPCAWAETPGADDAVFEGTEEMGMGQLSYFSFNEQALFFIPKGEEEDDLFRLSREVQDVRPMPSKNADCKAATSAWMFRLRVSVAAGACPVQRGFVMGRNFTNGVLLLDAYARFVGRSCKSAAHPAWPSWDVCAAFPSVDQTYLSLSYEAVGYTGGALAMLRVLLVSLYVVPGGPLCLMTEISIAFAITSSVPQGCPGSGTGFAIAIDPPLMEVQGKGRRSRPWRHGGGS